VARLFELQQSRFASVLDLVQKRKEN
jgi:hypothetical protein